MNSKHNAACILVVVAFLSVPSHADEKRGWGLSFGVGPSLMRDQDGTETFEGNGFGYNWGPEFRFSKRWALGMDFFSLGSAEDMFNSVETTIDVGGLELRGRLIFQLSENVELYGRLGFASYFADLDPGGSNLGEDATAVGIGLDIDRGEHFTIRFDGRYFDGQRDESGALLTAGFNYRF